MSTLREPYAWAALGYSGLAVALTFPLVLHLSSVVPHDVGDPLLSTAILWWNAHVVPFTTRWWNGFAFYPAPGFMAFSDPRLGESLLATPLQWLGCSPVAAYNLTLIATFPLCALAAHWLGVVLTRRHDAAAIAGLAYGFCPYRIAHLPHLELLAGFGMPAALAALHRYRDTRHARWLVVFGIAVVVQGLCSSYYLLFFAVLLALWLVWFTRARDVGALLGIVVAGGCALATLTPLVLGFARIHRYYGFNRTLQEVSTFSGDLTSLLTAHETSWIWGWTARWGKSEAELFPGAVISTLTIIAVVEAWRRGRRRDSIDRASTWLLAAAGLCVVIAFCGWAFAPWRVALFGLQISSDAPFKPMTLGLLALVAWVAASSRMRAAYDGRSPFAFYALATVFLFFCSFGPRPTAFGHQFLYEPPYAWLMRLPLFGSVRVPARFGMPAMLALAVTGALSFSRLSFGMRAYRTVLAGVLLGIAIEGWISPLALPAVPDVWSTARTQGFASVLELPLGETFSDLAAMYRATFHQRPVLNGNSGFQPRHYFTLRTALDERDATAFDGLSGTGQLLVVVNKRDDTNRSWDRFLATHPRGASIGQDDNWSYYAIEPRAVEPKSCDGEPVPIISIRGDSRALDARALTDGNPHTWWTTAHPQQIGDNLVLDLGHVVHPCAVTLAVGEFVVSYPRRLVVETAADEGVWIVVADRRLAGLTMAAALEDPKQVALSIPLVPSDARFVRLRLAEAHQQVAWVVADVAVESARRLE